MGQIGGQVGDGRAASDEDVSFVDLLRWVVRWWWLLMGGAFVGVLCGMIVHLSSDARFVVGLDLTIAESPLGTTSFVRDISTGFLRRQVGTAVVVEFDERGQRLSLVERRVPENAVAVRLAAMQNAAAALHDFLRDMAEKEYARMEESFAAMEPSPEAYANLAAFRRYLSALEGGLIGPAATGSESVRLQGLSLAAFVGLGALAGTGLGAASGLVAGAWRRRRASATG